MAKKEKNEAVVEKQGNTENLSPRDLLMQQLTDGIKETLDSENFANWCKMQGK